MTSIKINLASLILEKSTKELLSLEPYIIKKIKNRSLAKNPLIEDPWISDILAKPGLFYNRKALILELTRPTILEHPEILNYLTASHSLSDIFLLRKDLTTTEQSKLETLLQSVDSINISQEKIIKSCDSLFPNFDNNQMRLFTTLYYSYEFDKFTRKYSKTLLLDTHRELIFKVGEISSKIKDAQLFYLFNEILENNISTLPFTDRSSSTKSFPEIVRDVLKTIELL